MILLRPLFRLLVRVKGRVWVGLTAFRIYRRLPRFAQRRVRKRALRASPQIVNKLLTKKTPERKSTSERR
ncbi:MAG: hypothetical protein ABSB96_03765 [Gaiellaceae bacterium]